MARFRRSLRCMVGDRTRWICKDSRPSSRAAACPASLAERVTNRDALTRLPALVQHGRADEMLEIARARQSVELLRNLKVPVTFREYDCGHEVTADGVRDLSKFLIEKVAEPIIRV